MCQLKPLCLIPALHHCCEENNFFRSQMTADGWSVWQASVVCYSCTSSQQYGDRVNVLVDHDSSLGCQSCFHFHPGAKKTNDTLFFLSTRTSLKNVTAVSAMWYQCGIIGQLFTSVSVNGSGWTVIPLHLAQWMSRSSYPSLGEVLAVSFPGL